MSAEKQVSMKQRVKDLEAEVTELKTKLNQLRKAKSTTIVKREREVIYVGGEVRRRANEEANKPTSTDQVPHRQSPGQADFSEKNHGALRKDEDAAVVCVSGYSEEKELTQQKDEKTLQKEQEDSIRKLFQKISELNDENIALTMKNKELVCKVAQLTSELSVNEAKRCAQEEKMKAELSAEWHKKYDSWIEEMKKKVAEMNQNRE